MKKILEVLQFGEFDIRFNTDLDPLKSPNTFAELPPTVAFAMATKLWGGNENAVLAVIRALAIADLSLCINRKQIIRLLDQESEALMLSLKEAQKSFEKKGGKIVVCTPEMSKKDFDC